MTETWWGTGELPVGQTICRELGALRLWAERTRREWRIAWMNDADADPERARATIVASIPAEAPMHRHVFAEAPATLVIAPALAPRSIISRPLAPVHLSPRQSTTFYVGSPLWIRVAVGSPATTLAEIPSTPMADTWFGPNTVEGELCYADRTAARIDADDIPFRPFRAVTPVTFRNNDDNPITLERVIAPAPHLSLYQGIAGRIWTSPVSMEQGADKRSMTFTFSRETPREAIEGTRIAPPRIEPEGNVIHRAVSAFFA